MNAASQICDLHPVVGYEDPYTVHKLLAVHDDGVVYVVTSAGVEVLGW